MKIKYLAAACAALCSVSAFAATLDPTTTTPEVTFYIAGASAQKNALLATVPTTVFTGDVLYINGPKDANGVSSSGWLGMSLASLTGGTSKKTLVIYNSTNGSAAGLNQLLTTATSEVEANVLSLPASGCGSTSNVAAPSTAKLQITCTGGTAMREADMALSDVYATEFNDVLAKSGVTTLKNASVSTTGLEGFGVIVNAKLYDALLAKNIADGLLDTALCGTATASSLGEKVGNGDCQPSVRSADYASLVTGGGKYNSAAALVDSTDTTPITVCRRDNASGTQAASNIFFLNNVCGLAGYKGALAPATSADINLPTYNVVDSANDSTGKAEICVWSGSAAGTTAMSDYGIGVVSLGEKDAVDVAPAAGKTAFYFVKLDGVSPNYKADGSYDPLHRANLINGSYKFATEMAAYVKSGTAATSVSGKIAAAIATDIASAKLSDLSGIGYLTQGGATAAVAATKMARYRKGGNNCAAWK